MIKFLIICNLNFYIDQLSNEGIWDISWSWGSYPDEFAVTRRGLLRNFGKYTSGKACVYINKVADIEVDVLKALIKQSVTFLQKNYPKK